MKKFRVGAKPVAHRRALSIPRKDSQSALSVTDKENWDPLASDVDCPALMGKIKQLAQRAKLAATAPSAKRSAAFLTDIAWAQRERPESVRSAPPDDTQAVDVNKELRFLLDGADDMETIRRMLRSVQADMSRLKEEIADTNDTCLRVHEDIKGLDVAKSRQLLESNRTFLRKKN